MKKLIVTIGFIASLALAQAQEGRTMAVPAKNGILIEHHVEPKETLYSLARDYSVKVAQITDANGFEKDKTFSVGDKVKIPLAAENFNQKDSKGTPVYYEVGEKEGIMAVSNKFNKVLLKNLRSWNSLKSDHLSKGQQVIVGYVSSTNAATKEKTPIVAKAEPKPTLKQEAKATKPKKETIEKPVKTVAEPIKIKEENKQPVIDGNGYFKKHYASQTNPSLVSKKSVSSGIFKTKIGWNDEKFYLLADGIAAGTVIKIENPLNNAIIYAKVLGAMKGLKQNIGFDIRICDAAASALKIGDAEKFPLNIYY
jgi:LysM repeat protein